MNLQDVFNQLSMAELSQLSLGNAQSEDGICENDRVKLVPIIQTALTALFTRFRLKQGEVMIELVPDHDIYHLKQEYAASAYDSDKPHRYLMDDYEDPFLGGVLKIEKVRDDRGEEFMLNTQGHPRSVTLLSSTSFKVPRSIWQPDPCRPPVTHLAVQYRADHFKIEPYEGGYGAMGLELELPDTFLEALVYNVASRIYNPMGMQAEFHAGNSYFAKYEGACQLLEMQGMGMDVFQENNNFRRNGFV